MMHLNTVQRLLLLVLPAVVAIDLAQFAPGPSSRRIRGLMVGPHDDDVVSSKKVPPPPSKSGGSKSGMKDASKSKKGSKKGSSPKGPKGSKSKKGSKSSTPKKAGPSSSKMPPPVGSGQSGGGGGMNKPTSPPPDHGNGGGGGGGGTPTSSSKNPVTDDSSNGGGGGGGGGTKSCQHIPITFYKSDIPTYYKEGTVVEGILVGGLNSIPFYSTNSGDQLGTYSDGGIRYGTTTDSECVSTGAFSFFPFVNGTRSEDQVNVAFTCHGTTNSVTGGTGKFQGATGYEEFPFSDDKVVEANLVVCMCCGLDGGSSES